MIRLRPFFFAFAGLLALSGCRKVINLKLPTAPKRWVIDGSITNLQGGCRVMITQTADFNDSNNSPGISGAKVIISDNQGNSTALQETSTGLYEAPALAGQTGITYQLQVYVGGDTISAVSTMPVQVNFDSLFITNDLLFGNTWKLANVAYTDPSDLGHYYQFVQTVNGAQTPQIYTADNQLTAGRPQDVKLYLPPNTKDKDKTQSGDVVQVEMQCLDSAAHEFWFSAQQSASGSSQGSIPANPVTNLVGNALGVFSAHTSQTRSTTAL